MKIEHVNLENIDLITPMIVNLDARESREYKEQVIDIISNHHAQRVIISLKQIQFIDSSGLGAFLAILKNLHASGGELKLSEMNSSIRMIFELASMHKIFEIYNSTEDAVRSFQISMQ